MHITHSMPVMFNLYSLFKYMPEKGCRQIIYSGKNSSLLAKPAFGALEAEIM